MHSKLETSSWRVYRITRLNSVIPTIFKKTVVKAALETR
jgi:hypothetical protein